MNGWRSQKVQEILCGSKYACMNVRMGNVWEECMRVHIHTHVVYICIIRLSVTFFKSFKKKPTDSLITHFYTDYIELYLPWSESESSRVSGLSGSNSIAEHCRDGNTRQAYRQSANPASSGCSNSTSWSNVQLQCVCMSSDPLY